MTSLHAHNKAIVANSESPFVKLHAINFGDCQWTKGFWAEKTQKAVDVMIPYMGDVLCGDVGHALNNFKIAAGLKTGEHKGMYWHDGDFYKFMEAKIYAYGLSKDAALLTELDEYIDILAKAQEPDGYLQTQIQLDPDADRYENRKYHEMYNTGHLFISACAHFRITGQRNFLDVAIKHAELLYTIFFPDTKHYRRFGFNQTQIMGLVELYRTVGDKKYLTLAQKFIDRRGTYDIVHDSTTVGYPIGDMVQERTPLREETDPVGHAVLALYYYAGAADVFAETGEEALITALNRLWESVTQKKMYATGAVGQTHYGASVNRDMIEEGFIDDYMMPNLTAYNETCANLCNAMFSFRMLGIHGEAKYADIIELVMHNSGLSGISIEGKDYFYANPLRMLHGVRDYDAHADVTETPDREGYLACFCCPPNLVRTISNLSGWAYSLTDNGVHVNLYGSNNLATTMLDGSAIKLSQDTDYPWKGLVKLTVDECKSGAFDIALRVPGWSTGATITVNGKDAGVTATPATYAVLNREWQVGDVIVIDIPMETTFIEGHPRIEEVRNQVAVKRGPVVYCIESPDLPEGTNILDVYIDGEEPLKAQSQPEFLGGLTTIEAKLLLRENEGDAMYRNVSKPKWQELSTQLVPYYAWSNRGTAEMTVFMPVVWR
ncbi:glycoside hydrolase family 127 protein [Psychrosphaera sp. B3R10]|uniref:glycoside hydrolase family 127 protein n=1 Tax=unclassified Psychrosphaera TaxID=2641570 RepID=UPI001C0985F8|nr:MULTISPECIES: beta-L-arabinofuranosidase domain-containing protein [unclassified Psychrosphaera]MBU2881221.1 glycoside hydrolase family 127 protein [Psychrosphaera sp. I2R16]MBU2990064.1 glycoside hydrolase family 127 protein [Psychrosphaera sp. B3R10]